MKDKIGDKARLFHILDSIQEIEKYVQNISFDEFLENDMIQNACIRLLEVIGEASRSISEDIKRQFPGIEWREIVDLRNLLLHEYFGVDLNIVWSIIQFDIPPLKAKIQNILVNLDN